MGCGAAHAPRGVRPRPRSGPSERNIVVEIVLLAARARWAGVLGIGIRGRAATAAATTTGSATTSTAAAVGRARGAATSTTTSAAGTTRAAAAAAEHLQLIPDDFGRETL